MLIWNGVKKKLPHVISVVRSNIKWQFVPKMPKNRTRDTRKFITDTNLKGSINFFPKESLNLPTSGLVLPMLTHSTTTSTSHLIKTLSCNNNSNNINNNHVL